MAYTPTLADIEEIEGQQTKGSYQPSLADIEEIEQKKPDLDLLHSTMSDMLKRLTGQSPQGQALTGGARVGATEMERGVYNLIPRLAQTVGLKAPYQPATAQDFGEQKMLSPELAQQYPVTTEIGKIGGGMAATGPIGGIGSATRGASEALMPYLAKALAKNTGVMAALSPVSQPDTSIGQSLQNTFTDPLSYAAIAAGPAMHAAGAVGKKLKQMYNEKGGNASLEDVQKTVEAANGETKIPLGQAIDSVPMKGIQSTVLAYTPGSGMGKVYQQAGQSLSDRVGKVLNDLKPESEETNLSVGKKIQNSLKKSYENVQQESQNKYMDFSKSADDLGIQVNTDNYKNYAANKLKQLNENLSGNSELRKLNKTQKSDLKEILEDVVNAEPKSFQNAALATADLNDAIKDYSGPGNKYIRKSLNKLKLSLNKDIELSAIQSGNPEINQKYLDAKEHFANNVAPFESKQIYPYVRSINPKSPDTLLQTFIKTGQYDQPELLDQLISKSSDSERKAIAHEFLTKGLRENMGTTDINEDKILTAYSKLGDRSKKILFSDSERNELDKILHTRSLFGKDTKISDLISNPTGQKAAIQKILTGMATAGGGLAAALMSGHALPGTTEALGALIGAPLAARYMTKKIMSDAWKNNYVQSLLKRQLQQPKGINALPLLTYPAYVSSQNGGQ